MIERRFRAFPVAYLTLAMGCSTTTTPSAGEDTGTPEEDTGVVDTSVTTDSGGGETPTDSSKPDSTTDTGGSTDGGDTGTTPDTPTETPADTGPADTGPESCPTPGATGTGDCGKCGKRERLCGTDKKWLAWGACSGETGTCVPKETTGVTCGKCGTRTDTCNSTCEWDLGVCAGEGYCNNGDVETQYACSVPKYVKTRTCTDKCIWSDWSSCGPGKGWDTIADAPTAIAGRYAATGVWSGTEALIWGGNCSGSACGDGAAYKVSTDTWSVISVTGAPAGRYWHTAVWTGTEMIIWGGYTGSAFVNTGARYNPSTSTWTTMTVTNAPTARAFHTAVWTGTEMVVWGGSTNVSSSYAYGTNTGGAYNPSTNTWRTLGGTPPAARSGHAAIWTGSKMVIYGGGGTSGPPLNDAASLSISGTTDTWTTITSPGIDARQFAIPMMSGTTVTFMNGGSSTATPSYYARADGATFDPATSSWTTISGPSTTILPNPTRVLGSAWYGAGKVHVWGGGYYYGGIGHPYYISSPSSATSYCNSSYAQATGAIYAPSTSTWTAMPSGGPSPRCLQTTVWTGSEAIIFGGYSSSYLRDGKVYRP